MLVQPVEWIDLDAVHPQIPVQVCTRHPARPTDQADHLALLHGVAGIHKDLGLVEDAAVDPPAMVDEGRIPTQSEWSCKYNLAGRRRADLEAFPAAEIQARMEARYINVGSKRMRVTNTAAPA